MKKILIVLIIVASMLTLTSCGEDPKTFSFSSKATEAQREQTEFLQKKLDTAPFPKGVSFFPYRARYVDDNTAIVVEGFIRNNTESTIYSIEAGMVLEQNGEKIADGGFNFELNDFGYLDKHDSRPWSIRYSSQQILSYAANFNKQYYIDSDFTYSITENGEKFDIIDKETS